MRSIKYILNNLTPSHRDIIRKGLEEESRFNQYSVSIFDLYVEGYGESEVISLLNLNDRNFKTFERTIEKMIYQFYNLENQKFQDLIFSSIFYSIYTQSENEKDCISELEDLFHSMKQMEIDQAAAPLLKKLKAISTNTPLETLYKHLYTEYKAKENNINEMLRLLTLVFSKVEKLSKDKNNSALESYCLALIKELEILRAQDFNHSSNVIFQIARLSLYVFSNKKLNWEDFDAKECSNNLSKEIKLLPLDIYRYYLENIFLQLRFHLCKINNEIEKGIYLFDKTDIRNRIESNNLYFPNHMTMELIEEFNKPYTVKYDLLDKKNMIYTLRNN